MNFIKNRTTIAFLVFIVVFLITHFANFPGSLAYFKEVTHGQQLLDLKPEFTLKGVYQRLENFNESGRAAYLELVPTIDLIFPLSAFLFLVMFGRLAADKSHHPFYVRYYWVLPSMYLFLDFLENAFIVLILLYYPERLGLAFTLGYISVAKRIFMIASLVVPLAVLSLNAIRDRGAFSSPPK